MADKTIYSFPSGDEARLSEVGGKGLSLMVGSKAGLPVPPGFILTVGFFGPWLAELRSSPAWSEFLGAPNDRLAQACDKLKSEAAQFQFTADQERELSRALSGSAQEILFAVRSSSPEEDLESSSFAGMYETVLGVTRQALHDAIRKAFASCLDRRVVAYKRGKGFPIDAPKIAVVVQEQIASDVSGVGFSLDPLTNDHDDAVINANYGLGETVVAGTVTPDAYVIDKLSFKIKDKKLGGKETSLWLTRTGGTQERPNENSGAFSLTDDEAIGLARLIVRVEKIYGRPVDIEWAFSGGKPYLIQSRPITGYVPLPKKILTEPGRRRRLYWDVTLAVQGLTEPMSPAGASFLGELLAYASRRLFLRNVMHDPDRAPGAIASGRVYANLSMFMKLAGKKRIMSVLSAMDPLSAQALERADERVYASSAWRISLLPVGSIAFIPRVLARLRRARRDPAGMHERTQREIARFMPEARALAEEKMPLRKLASGLIDLLVREVLLKTMPLFLLGNAALAEMKRLASAHGTEIPAGFDQAMPYNVTTEMGLALYRVAALAPPDLDAKGLLKGIETKELPRPFLEAWEHFLSIYGFRGPQEIDLAAPRYSDRPELLLDIIRIMRNGRENPEERFARERKKREDDHRTLHERILAEDPADARRFESQYRVFSTFGGYRETHKYYVIFAVDLLRRKVLERSEALVEAGRLDAVEQAFDLSLGEIDAGVTDPSLDLRAQAKENRASIDLLAKVRHLPVVIDSRGRILRPAAPPAKEGDAVGQPVSPGIARGKVKVLHAPDEKPFEKGEILVARATDPGWTPLFVNAAAVVLEVGGALQHGALVAREYGIPCVTGIADATQRWTDGASVEVDGSAGSVRLLPGPERGEVL